MSRAQQLVAALSASIVIVAVSVWIFPGVSHTFSFIEVKEKSSFFGAVGLARSEISLPGGESYTYLTLLYTRTEGNPLPISGWVIESSNKKLRARIPVGTALFVQGVVPTRATVSLFPGESAIISPSVSPVGASFQKNICSATLERFQPFYPPLSNGTSTVEGFYNDCVAKHKEEPDFFLPEWRVFVDRPGLFAEAHDSILLMDKDKRLVAEYNY